MPEYRTWHCSGHVRARRSTHVQRYRPYRRAFEYGSHARAAWRKVRPRPYPGVTHAALVVKGSSWRTGSCNSVAINVFVIGYEYPSVCVCGAAAVFWRPFFRTSCFMLIRRALDYLFFYVFPLEHLLGRPRFQDQDDAIRFLQRSLSRWLQRNWSKKLKYPKNFNEQ